MLRVAGTLTLGCKNSVTPNDLFVFEPYAKNALNLFCHNPENFYFRRAYRMIITCFSYKLQAVS